MPSRLLHIALALALIGFGVFRFPAQLQCFKAGAGNGAPQFRLRNDRWYVFDARLLCSVIDLSFQNTFQTQQGLFQPARIVVIGKALDYKISLPGSNTVARAIDARDHIRELQL